MELTIIGSGTGVPTLKRASPANFLKIKNKNILIDCGPGTIRQLKKADIDYKSIDIIFITHFHTDHVNDIKALIHALNWTPDYKRKKGLTIIGPKGLKNFYTTKISTKPLPNTFRITLKEINNAMRFDGFTVHTTKTNHCKESIAYKFIENKKILIISGDAGYENQMTDFAKNSDVALLECSCQNNQKHAGHLHPSECGDIAKQAKIKKLILTHIYPTDEKKLLADTKKIFKNTILAKDLMKINI